MHIDLDRAFDKCSKIKGIFSRREARLLGSFINEIPKHFMIVEIGTYRARSTVFLAQFNRPVLTVDPLVIGIYSEEKTKGRTATGTMRITAHDQKVMAQNIKPYAHVRRLEGTVQDISPMHDLYHTIGAVFIDGRHEHPFPRNDFLALKPHMHKDTVIAFHDYPTMKGVVQSVDELVSEGHLMIVDSVSNLWIGKLKN